MKDILKLAHSNMCKSDKWQDSANFICIKDNVVEIKFSYSDTNEYVHGFRLTDTLVFAKYLFESHDKQYNKIIIDKIDEIISYIERESCNYFVNGIIEAVLERELKMRHDINEKLK